MSAAAAPWSVKGIEPKAREIAKDLARRSGMTLGEWLNSMIIEDGDDDGYTPLPRRAHAVDSFERRGRSRRVDDAYGMDDENAQRLSASVDAIAARAIEREALGEEVAEIQGQAPRQLRQAEQAQHAAGAGLDFQQLAIAHVEAQLPLQTRKRETGGATRPQRVEVRRALAPGPLAAAIDRAAGQPLPALTLDLDGAARTAALLKELLP